MKRYILVSGIGFYLITFTVIFYLTYANYSESQPTNAKVINVNTYDRVWQPSLDGFDKVVATQHAAMTDAKHVSDVSVGSAEGTALAAYGEYFQSLYTDEGEVSVPSVTQGDQAYTEAVCWHCHSQFVRPLASENHRWGPTSQIGEGAHDNPSRYGTRRIGPDLAREGRARSDDWHLAHFVNPKYTVPQSIMAPYGGISRYWYQVPQSELDARQAEIDEAMLTFSTEDGKVKKQSIDATFEAVAELNNENEEVWHVYKGLAKNIPVVRAAKKPKHRIRDLIAYVQSRGVGIGITKKTDGMMGQYGDAIDANDADWQSYIRKLDFSAGIWREQAPAPRPTGRPGYVLAPAELEALNPGKDGSIDELAEDRSVLDYRATRLKWDNSVKEGYNLFIGKCAGCHGGLDDDGDSLDIRLTDKDGMMAVGNGYGPAAAWLNPEPRNFHLSSKSAYNSDRTALAKVNDAALPARERGSESVEYKNRSGDPGSSLARPEDLFHTIRNGMSPSAMPKWSFLTDWQVWSLVNFIMYLGDGRQAITQEVDRFELDPETRESAIMAITRGTKASAVLGKTATLKGGEGEGKVSNFSYNGKGYYNLDEVNKAFNGGLDVPTLPLRKSGLANAAEDKAAAFWAEKLNVKVDGGHWTTAQLVEIGDRLFNEEIDSKGQKRDCMGCHGTEGDSWGKRRGELLHEHGFAARNYYTGTFKLGSSRDDIWRVMRYGIKGTLMNEQTVGMTALESLAIAEFVRDKARQGVMGIKAKKPAKK